MPHKSSSTFRVVGTAVFRFRRIKILVELAVAVDGVVVFAADLPGEVAGEADTGVEDAP